MNHNEIANNLTKHLKSLVESQERLLDNLTKQLEIKDLIIEILKETNVKLLTTIKELTSLNVDNLLTVKKEKE